MTPFEEALDIPRTTEEDRDELCDLFVEYIAMPTLSGQRGASLPASAEQHHGEVIALAVVDEHGAPDGSVGYGWRWDGTLVVRDGVARFVGWRAVVQWGSGAIIEQEPYNREVQL